MNIRYKLSLFALARHKGINLRFISGLPAKVPGLAFKKGNDRYIAVDASLPQPEQLHTALHELAHHELSHFEPQHRRFIPWYVNRDYKSLFMAEVMCRTKRWLGLVFGKEWQADLWALMVFPKVGTRKDLEAFLNEHPEKIKWFLVTVAGHQVVRARNFFRRIFQLDVKFTLHFLLSVAPEIVTAFVLVSSLSGPVPVSKTYGEIDERSNPRILRPIHESLGKGQRAHRLSA